MKVLVAEPMAAAGVALLKAQPGWDVVVANPKEYSQHLADCDALIVRSAVKVNAAVIAQAPKLRVIGRAGVGVDNVELNAATAAGILVMNTPGGNAVSVAEHTIALMLSLVRSIPQANASSKSGKWEKKKFMGTELSGKTLGIVGLGSVGRQVARRARAFEMRIVAFDPFVNTQTAKAWDVDLVDLPELYEQSDFITLHTALTPQSKKMLSKAAFDRMKTGVRIVNCARGELIDQAALLEPMKAGEVAGAALDAVDKEPPARADPLVAIHGFTATPHIGGSTEAAQEPVAVPIAQHIAQYFQTTVT